MSTMLEEKAVWTPGKEVVYWILGRQLIGDLLLEHLDWKDVVRLAAASPALWPRVEQMVEVAYKHCLPNPDALCQSGIPSRLKISMMTSTEVEHLNEYMQVFTKCAEDGDHKTAEWMADHFQITGNFVKDFHMNHILCKVCGSGNLPMAQWFADRFEAERWDCYGDPAHNELVAFHYACQNGHIHIAEWLTDRFGISKQDVRAGCYRLIWLICMEGLLETLQWLIHRFDLSRHDVLKDNRAFLKACQHGHLRVAKWMAEEYNIAREQISWYDKKPLLLACANGHTAVAKWLCKTYGFRRDYSLLQEQWRGIAGVTPEMLADVFEQGCANGTLKHVQWMIRHFGLSHDEVRGTHDRAMEWATRRNKLDTALWLAKVYYVNKMTDEMQVYLEGLCDPNRGGWRHTFRRGDWLELARRTNRDYPYPE